MAVCHTVVVDKHKETGEVNYLASSPDELALVNGARYLGVTYIGRDDTKHNILNVDFKG